MTTGRMIEIRKCWQQKSTVQQEIKQKKTDQYTQRPSQTSWKYIGKDTNEKVVEERKKKSKVSCNEVRNKDCRLG